jgi:hypothetical protein
MMKFTVTNGGSLEAEAEVPESVCVCVPKADPVNVG